MDRFCYCDDHILEKVHSWMQFDHGMMKPGEEIALIILWSLHSYFPSLSLPPFSAVSSIGAEAERRKRRVGERKRSTVVSAMEITQKWFLLPHEWNKKKVFRYRTGSTSSQGNLLSQRVTTIIKHYY